jgi:Cu(I)/Ag(I) efflux system membrane fusion protein
MKREILWVAAIASTLAVGGAGYWFGSHRGDAANALAPAPATPPGTHRDATAEGNAGALIDPGTGRRVLYWHDPMVPGQKFDRPGKSPFMDMELVPVFADEAAPEGVKISSSMASNLGIRTAAVRRANVATRLEVTGTVAENERATAVVQARVAGYIERLVARANFDAVAAGQPVAIIYAPDWAAAQAEYLALVRAHADAALVDAARQRLRLLSIPDAVIAAAERTGAPETRFALPAPRSGIVMDLAVREGAMVTPGMTLMRIVSLNDVWVYAEVPENVASSVRVGASAQVRLPSAPERVQVGRVSALLPQVSAVSRTVRARIELPNPSGLLKPGMLVNVALGGGERDATVVPQEAVISTGKRNVVIVRETDGRFHPVDVVVGRDVGDDIEILKGLEPGQMVVASGQFLLDSEASLKSALSRLDAAGAAPPAPVAPAGGTPPNPPSPPPTGSADPHAGHSMAPAPLKAAAASPPPAAADPHAGHAMAVPASSPPAAADPHAGHAMAVPASPPPAAADPHAGHATPSPSASTPPTATVYEGTGAVEAIGKDRLTLSHDPIPALQWPAMTMGFKAPQGGVPAGVKVGGRVRFSFARIDGGDFVVTGIAPIGGGSRP